MFSIFKKKSLTEDVSTAGPSGIQSQKPSNISNNHAPQNDCNCQYYTSGVPFKLSPKLSTSNLNGDTSPEVDYLLLTIPRAKVDTENIGYDFKLERSILQHETGQQEIGNQASTSHKSELHDNK